MKNIFLFLRLLCLNVLFQSSLSAENYQFTNEPIDVVIPTVGKDLPILEHCIKGIKENGANIRRVIVVSAEKYTDKAEWFDEKNYPFSKEDVAYYLCNCDKKAAEKYLSKGRVGWYYQQLLKFYAAYVIPDISSNVLVLDSDTIFLNSVSFLNDSNGGLYNVGKEYCREYFDHIGKLTNGLVKKEYANYSGITHHMLFQKPVLDDLFHIVENIHGIEFWKAFLTCVDRIYSSGAAEYELYFNFVISRTEQVEIRKLKFRNVRKLNAMQKYKRQGLHYISCHSWMRKP